MHPIIAQLAPSPNQLPAITARGVDVVLTAGAGTGKTRTLVARTLSLLADGAPLRKLVAVTFTTKAAREMRNRLRREIQTYLSNGNLDAAERTRWDTIYRDLDAARINTIHSLCGEILRNHPAEAGVDPRFSVLDEGVSTLLRQEAVEAALAWATDDPTAVHIFTLMAPGTLQTHLTTLLANRLKVQELFAAKRWNTWLPVLDAYAAAARDFVEDAAVCARVAALRDLRTNGALDRARAADDRLAPSLTIVLQTWDQITALQAEADWMGIAGLLPTWYANLKPAAGRAANWQPAAPKPILDGLKSAYESTAGAVLLEKADPVLDRALLALLPSLEQAFGIACDQYAAAKRARSALDFDDLESGALDLLRRDSDVCLRWQQEVNGLLVDEFQDTNARQRDLVGLLNGGRGRLFIVGDAKQSIYRFRGAEVQVFRTERSQIVAQGGAGYELATSYRTHAPLLTTLNTILAAALGVAEDAARPWREPFAPLTAVREACGLGLPPPYVELHLAAGSKRAGGLDRAAAALARRLREVSAAATGTFNYGDVAILCRSYSGFAAYEDALEAAGIPYLTVAGRGFHERPEVRDLLNALQAIADPTDDLALLGLLRSPAIGFSDIAIHHLRLAGDPQPGGLWRALCASEDPRGQQVAALVRGWHGRAGRTAVADLLKRFVDDSGYRAALLHAGQPRAARNVAKLLDDAQRSGLIGVGEFLEYIRSLRDVGSREGEARADVAGVVQIMTVHQAKGLEFPVVVLGDAASSGGRHAASLLLDDVLGLVLDVTDAAGSHPVIFQQASARAADMEDAESERLLYVAATRAQDLLLISGNITVTTKLKVSAGGWLKGIAQLTGLSEAPLTDFNLTGSRALPLALCAGDHPIACTLYEPKFAGDPVPPTAAPALAAPLPPWSPALLPPIPTATARTGAVASGEADRVWRVVPPTARTSAPAWVVGKLVHAAIAAWRFPFDDRMRDWATAQTRGYGIADDARVGDAWRKASELLARLQRHELFRELATAESRFHETPYTYVAGDGVEQGRMDLIYRADDRWTVVDFKSDRIASDAALAEWIAARDYRAQMERYAAAVTTLLGVRPRLRLCFLDYRGGVMVVPMADELETSSASS